MYGTMEVTNGIGQNGSQEKRKPCHLTIPIPAYLVTDNNNGGGISPMESLTPTGSLVAIITPEGPLENALGRSNRSNTERKDESLCSTILQLSVPFFIAGGGTIGAGLVLGHVTTWDVFTEISEVLILVPALLGLKGNLDMCLASRLSTQANLGNMETAKNIWEQVVGNIALVQVQAIVSALLVALFAVAVGAIFNGIFDWKHALLLSAASVITASSSCFVLDIVMIVVIIISNKIKLNPDNVATPLAASIGDVVSITVLANVASILYNYHEHMYWVMILIVACYLLLLPLWVFVVWKLKHTRHVLSSGWIPVLSALLISGLGGLVLNLVTERFPGYVVFQPIINGIGGNLVSVQASRLSTLLHQTSVLGVLPPYLKRILQTPWAVLLRGLPSAWISRILLIMAIAGHIVFAYLADFVYSGWEITATVPFIAFYVFVSILQVALLLYAAHYLVHLMWVWNIDPDNAAIPYLTALGDLSGSLLLALAFYSLHTLNKDYRPIAHN